MSFVYCMSTSSVWACLSSATHNTLLHLETLLDSKREIKQGTKKPKIEMGSHIRMDGNRFQAISKRNSPYHNFA